METVRFLEYYADKKRKIDENTPDLRFLRAICQGETDVENYFNETTVFRKRVTLDAPNGHFEGVDGIRRFAKQWLGDFKAKRAEIRPAVQTIAGGRVVSEIEVWFELEQGGERHIPMAVFCDLAAKGRMEGMRIYYFYKFLDGAVAYRPPIYRPRFMSWCEPPMMTGVVRFYYEQLHNFRTQEAIDNIVEMCSDDILYGGYRPEEEEPVFVGKEAVRKVYENICKDTPHHTYVRFETLTDDGVNCAAEWTLVVRKAGLAAGKYCFSGCAIYERDEEGKLCSIRICDNNGYEAGLDLNSIPDGDWYIE